MTCQDWNGNIQNNDSPLPRTTNNMSEAAESLAGTGGYEAIGP